MRYIPKKGNLFLMGLFIPILLGNLGNKIPRELIRFDLHWNIHCYSLEIIITCNKHLYFGKLKLRWLSTTITSHLPCKYIYYQKIYLTLSSRRRWRKVNKRTTKTFYKHKGKTTKRIEDSNIGRRTWQYLVVLSTNNDNNLQGIKIVFTFKTVAKPMQFHDKTTFTDWKTLLKTRTSSAFRREKSHWSMNDIRLEL